jgi:hypothetical protein
VSEEKREHQYKTKADRQREVEQAINESLPSIDVGQFIGVRARLVDPETEAPRALAVGRRIMFGASFKDACLIEGVSWRAYKDALKRYRAAERKDTDEEMKTEPVAEGTWTYAVGYTIDRGMALCRLRWQMLAEAGGKGSKAALWMLERRGGREYLPPVRREQVTSTTTTTTNTNTTLTLEAKLEATKSTLGFSDEHLAQMGDWLAQAQTAAQRGDALPAPPSVQRITAPGDKVIDIEAGED